MSEPSKLSKFQKIILLSALAYRKSPDAHKFFPPGRSDLTYQRLKSKHFGIQSFVCTDVWSSEFRPPAAIWECLDISYDDWMSLRKSKQFTEEQIQKIREYNIQLMQCKERFAAAKRQRNIKERNAAKSISRAALRLQQRGLAIRDGGGINLTDDGILAAKSLIKSPEYKAIYEIELEDFREMKRDFNRMSEELSKLAAS
jgi:hypothetical protein